MHSSRVKLRYLYVAVLSMYKTLNEQMFLQKKIFKCKYFVYARLQNMHTFFAVVENILVSRYAS